MLAVLCGVVSTVVFLRRLAFVADALTHTMFPGVAIAFFMGESLFVGALGAAVVSTVVLALLARQRRLDPDSVLAVLITRLLLVGVVVVSRRTSYQSDLTDLAVRPAPGRRPARPSSRAPSSPRSSRWRWPCSRKELLLTAFDPGSGPSPGLSASPRSTSPPTCASPSSSWPPPAPSAPRWWSRCSSRPARDGAPVDPADRHDGGGGRRASSRSRATSGSSCRTTCRCTTTCACPRGHDHRAAHGRCSSWPWPAGRSLDG